MSEPLIAQTSGRVMTLTLNRPEKRNALSGELIAALRQQLDAAQGSRDIGAVVLTGAGDRAFCAGGDLAPPQGDGLLDLHAQRRGFAELLSRIYTFNKPIVGAAQGHALAGGFGLLLACDVVVARRDARYGTPEIKRGLFPMMIVAVLLRVLGRRRTLQLSLTGQEIDAEQLLAWGGCNEVCDAEQVLPRAQAWAAQLGTLSPAILALGKDAINQAEDLPLQQQLESLRAALTLNSLAEDALIGVQAFFQKEQPTWVGR